MGAILIASRLARNALKRSTVEPQAAQEIERLRLALSFYADGRRYQGPNQRPIPDDPFAKPDAVYINDVTRDNGSIAARALSRPQLGAHHD
jgi:hypothetical protein